MHTINFNRPVAVIVFTALCSLIKPAFAQNPELNLQSQRHLQQDTAMYWENKPDVFNIAGKSVTMHTNSEKYLWGDSHEFDFDFPYSHFYHRSIGGNFTAETIVLITSNWNYGNAGLLVKLSKSNWIKLYIGKEMNMLRLNTVYASDVFHSDYCTTPIQADSNKIWLRVSCYNWELRLKYSTDGLTYKTVRILNMPASYKSAQVGLMADSPMTIGFDASFENFRIRDRAINH